MKSELIGIVIIRVQFIDMLRGIRPDNSGVGTQSCCCWFLEGVQDKVIEKEVGDGEQGVEGDQELAHIVSLRLQVKDFSAYKSLRTDTQHS